MLQARRLWDAIDKGTTDFVEDRMALEALTRGLPPKMSGTIATKSTAKNAWDSLKSLRVGDDRVRKAKVGTLKREFDTMKFRSGETIDDFAVRINAQPTCGLGGEA